MPFSRSRKDFVIQAPIPDGLCDGGHILSAVFRSALALVQARDKAHRHLQRAIATWVKPGSLDDVRPLSRVETH